MTIYRTIRTILVHAIVIPSAAIVYGASAACAAAGAALVTSLITAGLMAIPAHRPFWGGQLIALSSSGTPILA